jgi:(p)ppGpp synthase/HD superfamily hydrolase
MPRNTQLDRSKEYGNAAHEAWKKGDNDKAEALWERSQEDLLEVYKILGLT